MKNSLRFLISIVFVFVAFVCDAQDDDCTILCDFEQSEPDGNESEYIASSLLSTDFYLPRQVSGANALNIPTPLKRTSSEHKNNSEFVKAGKIINLGIGNFLENNPLNILSAFTKANHRLICFGRLII